MLENPLQFRSKLVDACATTKARGCACFVHEKVYIWWA